jgi:hypothetical protein
MGSFYLPLSLSLEVERMNEQGVPNKLEETRSEPVEQVDKPYSVKFSIDGSNVPYQLKIWNKATKSVYFLVKDNTDLFHRLNVGDILNMEYYETDITYPSEHLETVIRHITLKRQVRLKGHYLVSLEILESQAFKKTNNN